MFDNADMNPYAPPEVESRPIAISGSLRQRLWLRRLCVLQMIVIVCSLAVEAFEHESIIGSGPVFAVVGLVIAVFAYRQQDMLAFLFGVSAIALTGLIVFLINFNGWGPTQGDKPITMIAFVYAPVALLLASVIISRQLTT